MSSALVIAIWITSATVYEVALPFDGSYRTREFANSEQGIDDFTAWLQSSGHDKVDMYCVGISGGEETAVARFWREAPANRVFFVNPFQVEAYAKKHGAHLNAQTLAATCAEMFQHRK